MHEFLLDKFGNYYDLKTGVITGKNGGLLYQANRRVERIY